MHTQSVDLIIHHGRIHTMDDRRTVVDALACSNGRFVAAGPDADILALAGPETKVIDAGGRTIVPGLNDSHLHLIRGGLNYTMELRWDGVPSVADALRMLKEQAARTPAPLWVRVVGGFNEFQFAERRLPTLAEINEAAPDTPVFILHLYDRAMLNRAALRAVGYTASTPEPPGGEIVRDSKGEPTGLLVARPNAFILYKTLSLGPKLASEDQYNSSRHFMRELNRLGVTSCADAGGGFQNYPDDYQIIQRLHQQGHMTVRVGYNLFTQNAGKELQDFEGWTKQVKPGQGDDFLKHNGAGEMLVFSAADFEDFLEPRPDLPSKMEGELHGVVSHLAKARWPFRLHATYDQTISRALDVYEAVHRETGLHGLHWFIDHAETISDANIERIKELGGGIAVQHRMAFQGEYFASRYGIEATKRTPPLRRMLKAGVPVGGGTDATRVASYNPWTSISWMVTGRTVGGMQMYDSADLLTRYEAMHCWTRGSAWFTTDEAVKGSISNGMLADCIVLSDDYFSVPDDAIRNIESVLTIVGGKIVFGQGPFAGEAPPLPPVSPDWSPVRYYGGHWRAQPKWKVDRPAHQAACTHARSPINRLLGGMLGISPNEPALECSCWSF